MYPIPPELRYMKNIVIYVDSSSDQSYDDLIKKFEWGEPYNV